MLLSGEQMEHVRLMTPKGIELYLDVECITRTAEYAECAVRKFSGDDPDVTDGLLVFARVEIEEEPEKPGRKDTESCFDETALLLMAARESAGWQNPVWSSMSGRPRSTGYPAG